MLATVQSAGFDGVNIDIEDINYSDRDNFSALVMTYDEHGYVTGPGPVASAKWVDKVIKYTVSVIPQNKVLLGIPAYGFDWTVDKRSPMV